MGALDLSQVESSKYNLLYWNCNLDILENARYSGYEDISFFV